MWQISTMERVWALGGFTAIWGWMLWDYAAHEWSALLHHPGFFAFSAVFGCATLALSRWPLLDVLAVVGTFYSLGWVFVLEHFKF